MVNQTVGSVGRYRDEGDGYKQIETFGTSFFVNGNGVFLTAAHVLRGAQERIQSAGGIFGISMLTAFTHRSHVGTLVDFSFAPEPYDIAVGLVEQPSSSIFNFSRWRPAVKFRTVHTFGYPASQTYEIEETGKRRNGLRRYEGSITGFLRAGSFLNSPPGPHPQIYETDFPIPLGVSGAPLVTRPRANFWPRDFLACGTVIGVCVGSRKTEEVKDSITTVEQDGTVYREKKIRIEQTGLVHSLDPLYDWKPDCLYGRSLGEVSKPTIL